MAGLANYLFIAIMLVVIIVVAVVLYRSRGWAEQKALSSALGTLTNNEYGVIENLGLRTDEGVIVVERVIVSIYGVFVIIASDRKGRINGDEDEPVWSNVDFGTTTTFENPIMVNQRAIDALQSTLTAYPETPFISIVGFPMRDVLNVKATVQVTDISKVMDIIRSYNTQMLTVSDATGIAAALRAADANNADDSVVLSDMI